MKFVSKFTNFRVVLKPGLPAQPVVGIPATPGLSIKFEDGFAEVANPEHIEMLKASPDYVNKVIMDADPEGTDEFVRTNISPEHNTMEIGFGRVMKSMGGKSAGNPEAMKLLKKMAMELFKEELPKMAKAEAMKIAPQLAMDLLNKMNEEASETPAVTVNVAPRRNPNSLASAPAPLSAEDVGLSEVGDDAVDMEPAPVEESELNENLSKTTEKKTPSRTARGASKT